MEHIVNTRILPKESSPKARSKLVLSQIWLLVRGWVLEIPEACDVYVQHIREILSDSRETKSIRFIREVERNIINILTHIANWAPEIFNTRFQPIIMHHDNAMEFIEGWLETEYSSFFSGKSSTLSTLCRAHLGHYLHTKLANVIFKKEFFDYLRILIHAWQVYPNIVWKYIDEQYWLFPVNVYMQNDDTFYSAACSKVPKWKEWELVKRLNILSFFTSKFNWLPDAVNEALGVQLGINNEERYLVNSLILLVDPEWITAIHEVRKRRHDVSPYILSDPLPENRTYH
jgi:hypothetical protein